MADNAFDRFFSPPLVTTFIAIVIIVMGTAAFVMRGGSVPLNEAWTLRKLDPQLAAAVQACTLDGQGQKQCAWLAERLAAQANDVRPVDAKAVQPSRVAPEPPAETTDSDLARAWALRNIPENWAQSLTTCFRLAETEDQAPPPVEQQFSACKTLTQAARAIAEQH